MYIKSRNLGTIFLSHVESDEVETIIKGIKLSNPGWDLKNPRMVKLTYHTFLFPLIHVLSLSVAKGNCQDDMKIAKVTLVYQNDTTSICNYGPIMNLSLL